MANSLVEKSGNLPELPRNEQIYQRANQIVVRRHGPQRLGMGRAESSLADLDALLPDAQAVLDDLRALARPATKLEIAKQLAILVKCYPNIGTADGGEIYGRLLIEDVAAMQPSAADVEGACRKLRRTSRFCPVIAEVLEAISQAKHHLHDTTNKIADITKSRADQVKEVEKEQQRHEEYLDYQRTCGPPINYDPTALPL